MPVTEFAILKLKEPYTVESEVLREPFQSAAERQSAWSGYPLTFYTGIQDSSLLYIVAGWNDADAHRKWIASDENKKYMTILGPMISVGSLAHVDVDFSQILSNTQVLLFRKKILDNEGTEQAKGSPDGRQPTWARQGIDVDNPKDLYYFEAYDNFDESTNTQADGFSILRRVYF